MSVPVIDFKWNEGRNDLQYIKLLELTLENERSINRKAVAKIKELTHISNSEKMELIGCIIDVFEDFLESKGINIENEDKAGEEGEAIIYGGDYDELARGIEAILAETGMLR